MRGAGLKSPINEAFENVGKVGGLGFLVATGLVLSFITGNWLDQKIGTRPLFTLLFPFLTLAAIFLEFYRWAKQLGDQKNEDGRNDENNDGNEDV